MLKNYPGWLADLIREHGCGVAVPPRDPRAFVDAMEQLADDPQERRTMRDRARQLRSMVFAGAPRRGFCGLAGNRSGGQRTGVGGQRTDVGGLNGGQ